MFVPPAAVSGTSGHPITFTVVTPGGVGLDGQEQLKVIELHGNSWLVLDGFRAHDVKQVPNTSYTVVQINGGAHDNIIKNLGAWNSNALSPYANNDIIHIGDIHTINNRIDTYYTFGTARKDASVSYGPGQNVGEDPGVWTNVFFRGIHVYDWSANTGPKWASSAIYNAVGTRYIDMTAFWTQATQPPTFHSTSNQCQYTLGVGNCPTSACQTTNLCGTLKTYPALDQAQAMVGGSNNNLSSNNKSSRARYFGTIAIVRSQDHSAFDYAQMFVQLIGDYQLKDVALFLPPGRATRGLELLNCQVVGSQPAPCPSPVLLSVTNVDTIGGSVADIIDTQWTQDHVRHLSNNSTFDYQNVGGAGGGSICVLHNDDGTLSATKRWPHPLGADLVQKMVDAGYTGVDEYSEVGSAAGAIPAACDTSAGGATPTPSLTPTTTPTSTQTFTFTPTSTPTQTPTLTPTVTPGGPTVTPVPASGICRKWVKCSGSNRMLAVPCSMIQTQFVPCPWQVPTPP